MKRKLKKMALMLLCIMTISVPAGGTAAVFATDTSQSYRFDLTANGSSQTCAVKAGEKVEVAVSLTRTDSSSSDDFTMYAVQYDLLVDSRYFTIDSSSLTSSTKGVQTFTTDMSKNGSWSGYKKITAAAVSASGSQWSNGSTILKCTLTAVRTGTTELKPYNSIVSVSSGMDKYKADSDSVKVTVAAADDENNGSDESNDDSKNDDGNSGGNTSHDSDNSGNSRNNGSSSNGSSSGSGRSDSTAENEILPGNANVSVLAKFTDMDQHWSRAYVEYAVKKGYFSGMTSTQFGPDKAMNRAMLVTVLWRMENSPSYSGTSVFTDVTSGAWYSQAVQWAADKGIVSGAGNGRFMPESPVTREQLVQIIRNYAKYKGADITASADFNNFSDASSVSSWAQDAFKWGIASGIISGTGNGILSPKGSATRAQVAKILEEFDKNILKTA